MEREKERRASKKDGKVMKTFFNTNNKMKRERGERAKNNATMECGATLLNSVLAFMSF